MQIKLDFSRISAILIPVSERNITEENMNKPYYYVLDEDGLYRMFDVSHEGLENAIKACREICKRLPETCVMICRKVRESKFTRLTTDWGYEAETVWSLKVSNNEFPGRC